MGDEANPFGFELYVALKHQPRGPAFLRGMSYAAIQKLKTAPRAEALELFRNCNYDVLRRIKRDSPEDLASYLSDRIHDMERKVVFMGLYVWPGF